ncbi:D-alanyl-D-alanine carboxypeptidase [Bacillus sp. SLBN-46]|uniref:M15 family metallopeptidase n=1 Tax=Bacillus sp. SLBN-46 TaxID=3042283 RepID=UPI00285AAD1D|nr:M15 family metallopeptidase [Bacillus sp. SLBN-46]MDR6121553.1 D-alanyl-D-alanine carboxypeptidase [Bacillus sp. SLBN-46]
MSKLRVTVVSLIILVFVVAGCSLKIHFTQNDEEKWNNQPISANKSASKKKSVHPEDEALQVVSSPEAIPVLINKNHKLPDGYTPTDLVYPDIPFTFEKKTEKRKLREKAAVAIEKLFAGAREDGVDLLGVSAYRSHQAQTVLFNYYVSLDGYESARTYSAIPGTSEHETGLAIDVTGGDGKCAAEDCFAGTPEANWLEMHAAEYGFIIRYPNGKDAVTGYKYEPWHLRYVGKSIAKQITNRGITLEEYLKATPVNN